VFEGLVGVMGVEIVRESALDEQAKGSRTG
jgi:hypothetical protein